MALLLDNIGLNNYENSIEILKNEILINISRTIYGYSNVHYINSKFVKYEFWLSYAYNKARNKVMYETMHTQGINNCEWNLKYSGIDLRMDKDRTKFEGLFTNIDSTGAIPIQIINYDVLPGLIRGDDINLQVVSFPIKYKYYTSYEEYKNDFINNYKIKVPKIGSITPLKYIDYDFNIEDSNMNKDLYVLITANVSRLERKTNQLTSHYINGLIHTEYGDLEYKHSCDDINIKELFNDKSKIISMVAIISGDAAINEYTDGAVYDEKHLLKLLRYYLLTVDGSKIVNSIDDNVELNSLSGNIKLRGKTNTLIYFNEIAEQLSIYRPIYYVYEAIITSVSEPDNPNRNLYHIGKKCLVLSYDSPDNCESLLFIERDENNKIKKILLDDDKTHSYTYRIIKPKQIIHKNRIVSS